jgi:hypothetical protein
LPIPPNITPFGLFDYGRAIQTEALPSAPRTCRSLRGTLSMRQTDCMGQPPGSLVARGRAVGEKPHVRHEAAGVHHAARRRGRRLAACSARGGDHPCRLSVIIGLTGLLMKNLSAPAPLTGLRRIGRSRRLWRHLQRLASLVRDDHQSARRQRSRGSGTSLESELVCSSFISLGTNVARTFK